MRFPLEDESTGQDFMHFPQHGGQAGAHGRPAGMGREVQQLIEAMSRFSPASGETTSPRQEADWHGVTLATGRDLPHRFKELRVDSLL
jgi:hypothetical protein